MSLVLIHEAENEESVRGQKEFVRRNDSRHSKPPAMPRVTITKNHPTTNIDIWRLRDGTRFTLRSVSTHDAPLLGELVARSSASSRRNRFHAVVNSLSDSYLDYMCCVDYDKHVAFVITTEYEGLEQVIAEVRYVIDSQGVGESAEFALLVDDRWQRCGLGERAMRELVSTANRAGVRWLHGDVLSHNFSMLVLMQKCGFCCTPDLFDSDIVHVEISLKSPWLATMKTFKRASDPVLLRRLLHLWFAFIKRRTIVPKRLSARPAS
jgi:RimJ/RimL family protein N-acetyltransferase